MHRLGFIFGATAAVLVLAACSTGPQVDAAPDGPVDVIFDTDFGGDVDDAGVLDMLNTFVSSGEAHVLAIITSNPGTTSAVVGIDCINQYYGNSIPIGVRDAAAPRELLDNVSESAALLTDEFPHDVESQDELPSATELYGSILADAPGGSVTIVATGSHSNHAHLLCSPSDEVNSLAGTDLVAKKVKRFVTMGGVFPAGDEWNMMLDPSTAAQVATSWPTEIVYSGFELGVSIETGEGLVDTPATNPVHAAYESCVGTGNSRESWDRTAMHFAIRGDGDNLFTTSAPGRVNIDPQGGSTFEEDSGASRRYLTEAAPDGEISAAIEALTVAPPAQ